MDQTSTGYCLFCFSFDKNGIQIFSENGKQLNIVQIISEHFWFQVKNIWFHSIHFDKNEKKKNSILK